MSRHSIRSLAAVTLTLPMLAVATAALAAGPNSPLGVLANSAPPRRMESPLAVPDRVPVADLGPLIAASRTGILYDRVLPLSHLERFDGSAAVPVIDLPTWRQAWDELRRASLAAPGGPDLATLAAAARADQRRGIVDLALLDLAYERIRRDAVAEGAIVIRDGRVLRADSSALVTTRAFAASALEPRTYRGGDVTFELDADRIASDLGAPRAITIDFADGLGVRPIAIGAPVHVHYSETGPHTLTLRATRADGGIAVARFAFEVAAVTTPLPNDTLHITANVAYQGTFGTGDAYEYLAAGHTALENPIVVIEGFDIDNSMNWDELYTLLDQENLIETLRADGFDAVVLNFTDATQAIQTNAFVVEALLERVQSEVPPTTTMALVGASMGGLCSRYALAYMESHGITHRVRVWLSFDGPQAGADIPLGLQYWINFFAGQSTSAADFLATLQRPAAREMLLYHFTSPAGPTGAPDPSRTQLIGDLAAIGDYPQLTRRVAIANGSGTGVNQGFAAGAEVIRYEYSSLLTSITGDVWALPDQVSGTIFNGSLRILLSTTSQKVTVSGCAPWDGAPGGSRASFTELDTTSVPYGDIVALFPSHCFIPSVSAIAVAGAGPFYDIAGDSDLLAHTPFDAVYTPTTNQEHVTITAENAAWVRMEVERGVLGIPGAGPAASVRLALRPVPNPFSDGTSVACALPAAAPVDLVVYDLAGREVRPLLHERRPAGTFIISWDGRDARGARVGSGIYLIRLTAGGSSATRRIVRL